MSTTGSTTLHLAPLCISAVIAVVVPSFGLSPHEVLVLVNRNSSDSMEVANHFCSLRDVPLGNRVDLDLPTKVMAPRSQISSREFQTLIWEPTLAYIEKHGLGDHILAWVYSVDFPTTIHTRPPMSLQGMTLLGGQAPDPDVITKGNYMSPFYAGPDRPNGIKLPTRPFSRHSFRSFVQAPVPSFSLGHIGSRGTTVVEVIENLRRGASSDHTNPTEEIIFFENENIRSTCRAWQYPAVIEELESLGITAKIATQFPDKRTSFLGLFLGAAKTPSLQSYEFVPGSIAEHLTSHAGNFDAYLQHKCTRWLRNGVTASSGTIAEPYALWSKFPHARLFAHYAKGCTVLESFFQAIRCPLQTFLVGDPLAAPFAPDLSVELTVDVKGSALTLHVSPDLSRKSAEQVYDLFLDDRPYAFDLSALPKQVPIQDLSDGYHQLRVVVATDAATRTTVTDSVGFVLKRKERKMTFRTLPERLSLRKPITIPYSISGTPDQVTLISGTRRLDQSANHEGTFTLDPAHLGLGPSSVQVQASYPDGKVITSEPTELEVFRPKQPIVRFQTDVDEQHVQVNPDVTSDSAQVEWAWFRSLSGTNSALDDPFRVVGGDLKLTKDRFRLTSTSSSHALCLTHAGKKRNWKQIHAELVTPGAGNSTYAGLVFNVYDDGQFDYFGMQGRDSAWIFASFKHGKRSKIHDSRGRYFPLKRWTDLVVRETKEGLEGVVDGQVLLQWSGGKLDRRGIGVMAQEKSVVFRQLWASPLFLEKSEGKVRRNGELHLRSIPLSDTPFFCLAWDGASFAKKQLTAVDFSAKQAPNAIQNEP